MPRKLSGITRTSNRCVYSMYTHRRVHSMYTNRCVHSMYANGCVHSMYANGFVHSMYANRCVHSMYTNRCVHSMYTNRFVHSMYTNRCVHSMYTNRCVHSMYTNNNKTKQIQNKIAAFASPWDDFELQTYGEHFETQWILWTVTFRGFIMEKVRVKVKFTLKQATMESRLQLYCFFNLGARWGWVINITPLPLYPWERPVSIV
jgi:hypothetical protein